jgi:hypothetical protein
VRVPLRKLLKARAKPKRLPKPGVCALCLHPKREHEYGPVLSYWKARTSYGACKVDECRCSRYMEPPKAQKSRRRWLQPWNTWWRVL